MGEEGKTMDTGGEGGVVREARGGSNESVGGRCEGDEVLRAISTAPSEDEVALMEISE